MRIQIGKQINIIKRYCEKCDYMFILIFLMLLQISICIFLGFHKQYLFTDEVYSYGLANSENYTFLEYNENWESGKYFSDYLKYNVETKFSFDAAFKNQANDVHPPLYYCLLHIISFFFKDYVYGVWPALLLNLIVLLMIDFVLFYIASYLMNSKNCALYTLILWGFSAAGLSNIILFRMYLLQTLEILVFIALHIYILEHKRKMTIIYWLGIVFTVAIGGLTQYYFYFYIAFFGAMVCIYFLLNKKIVLMFQYGIALVGGLVTALLIFPYTFRHIFGVRGAYATEHIGEISKEKVSTYLHWMNKSMFGGMIKIIIVIFLIVFLWSLINCFFLRIKFAIKKGEKLYYCKIVIEKVKIKVKDLNMEWNIYERDIILCFSFIADIFLIYIGIIGSEIINPRYIYPVYPILAIVFVKIFIKVFAFLKNNKLIGILVMAFICISSIKVYGIDWMYWDYPKYKEQLNAIAGNDCIIICRSGGWINTYEGINAYMMMDECSYLFDCDIEIKCKELLDRRETKNRILASFPSDFRYNQDEIENILDRIVNEVNGRGYELKYDYYTKIYEIY